MAVMVLLGPSSSELTLLAVDNSALVQLKFILRIRSLNFASYFYCLLWRCCYFWPPLCLMMQTLSMLVVNNVGMAR